MTVQRQHYGVTLAVLLLGALAYALSQTLVAPALPTIQRELDTSTTAVAFVLTAYLLSASIATPIAGRLGDMFGKERVLVLTLFAFGLGSLVCALSSSIELLVAGRAIQGIGGAVFPLSFGIVRDEFPPERVATGIGMIGATFGVGGGAGLVLSGPIVDHLSWTWIFWLGLAVVAVSVVATHLFVPESPVKSPAKIDWLGAALLSAGLAALLFAISQASAWGWTDARVLALIAGAALALSAWVAYERRLAEPLVDMTMMRDRAVLTTNLTTLLVGFGMFGTFVLIPQFVQTPPSAGFGFGATVTEAGLFMLPSTGVMLLSGPVAGWLGSRFSSKLPLVLGTGLATVSYVLFAFLHDDRWAIYLSTSLLGVGIGFSFAATANLVVEAVDQRQTGVAGGINTIMRTVGGALGLQLAATIVAGSVVGGGLPQESAYTEAFLMCALGVAAACLLSLAIPGRRRAEAARRGEPVAEYS